MKEANKQLSEKNVYKEVEFRKEFTSLNLKYFSSEFKKTYNLGKLYLLPKIYKCLSDVPGRPVISNCGTPTEKAPEFLDFQLKLIMGNGNSCIRD